MRMGMKKSNKVKVGDKAPDFALPDQSAAMVSLKEYIGNKIIVHWFYPRGFSRWCTADFFLHGLQGFRAV
jgi:peroxiredoxin